MWKNLSKLKAFEQEHSKVLKGKWQINQTENELSYMDIRYGCPSTALKQKDGKYLLTSRRDIERGIITNREYTSEAEAVAEFLKTLEIDTYFDRK